MERRRKQYVWTRPAWVKTRMVLIMRLLPAKTAMAKEKPPKQPSPHHQVLLLMLTMPPVSKGPIKETPLDFLADTGTSHTTKASTIPGYWH